MEIKTVVGRRYPETLDRERDARRRARNNGIPPSRTEGSPSKARNQDAGPTGKKDAPKKAAAVKKKQAAPNPVPSLSDVRWEQTSAYYTEADRGWLIRALDELAQKEPIARQLYETFREALNRCSLRRVELHHAGSEVSENGRRRSLIKVRVPELDGKEFVVPRFFFVKLRDRANTGVPIGGLAE